MPLVTTKEMFRKAYEGGYAIGAFNVNNMEIVQAITEAAQSRLTYIHGAREDLLPETYRFTDSHRRLERFFSRMPATEPWAVASPTDGADLARNHGHLRLGAARAEPAQGCAADPGKSREGGAESLDDDILR